MDDVSFSVSMDAEDDEAYLVPDVGLTDDLEAQMPTECFARFRWRVHRLVDNIFIRLFSIFLILTDIILLIILLATKRDVNDKPFAEDNGIATASDVIVLYFLLELSLRIFALTPSTFIRKPFEVFDAIIIIVSAILQYAPAFSRQTAAVKVLRIVRLIRFLRFITELYKFKKAARLTISENKRRYRRDGFDLDLTYITDRVIAMSFPSTGLMAVYRNPMKAVVRFFNRKHNNHYRVYNLCSERGYNHKHFDHRVVRCSIDDHNVPLLREILEFCEDADTFLSSDENNVIAVHCKGGKGRTGTMICSYLLYSGKFDRAKDALDYFALRRSDYAVSQQYQGVQTPSQGRFVTYFQEVVNTYGKKIPPLKENTITRMRVHSIDVGENAMSGVSALSFEVFNEKELVFSFDDAVADGQATINSVPLSQSTLGYAYVDFSFPPIEIKGNVKVKFLSTGSLPLKYDKCPFYFWFHTSFVHEPTLRLDRRSLDNPHKESVWKYYDENFAVEMHFSSQSRR
eukprot:m.45051 g.45051  ORF g.45051 m.45051 type:complete len:514 (-) comp10650_c0_seq2:829-2370(-)